MMDNFAQILRQLPMGEASSLGGHATPFKVQVNFDIPFVITPRNPLWLQTKGAW
jgi:hypothetical protein